MVVSCFVIDVVVVVGGGEVSGKDFCQQIITYIILCTCTCGTLAYRHMLNYTFSRRATSGGWHGLVACTFSGLLRLFFSFFLSIPTPLYNNTGLIKMKIRPGQIILQNILAILLKLYKCITWSNTVRRLQEGQLHGTVYISSVYCIHKSYPLSPAIWLYSWSSFSLSLSLSHDTLANRRHSSHVYLLHAYPFFQTL